MKRVWEQVWFDPRDLVEDEIEKGVDYDLERLVHNSMHDSFISTFLLQFTLAGYLEENLWFNHESLR